MSEFLNHRDFFKNDFENYIKLRTAVAENIGNTITIIKKNAPTDLTERLTYYAELEFNLHCLYNASERIFLYHQHEKNIESYPVKPEEIIDKINFAIKVMDANAPAEPELRKMYYLALHTQVSESYGMLNW